LTDSPHHAFEQTPPTDDNLSQHRQRGNSCNNTATGQQGCDAVRRGVVGVLVADRKFLVIRRAAGVRAPGRLCFPGGHIEPGETEAAAIRREWQEELGLDIEPVRKLWESVTGWNVHLAWWFVKNTAPLELTPNPSEVAEVLWYTTGQLRSDPDVLEGNLPFLDQIARTPDFEFVPVTADGTARAAHGGI